MNAPADLPTDATLSGDAHWLNAGRQNGPAQWLDNACGSIFTVPLGATDAPLTVCQDNAQTSYVASLPSGWARYAAVEAARRLPAWLAPLSNLAQAPLHAMLRSAGLHRAALLDNWLVSTNLHPQCARADWQTALDAAIALTPDRPVAIRSICDAVSPGLPAQLQTEGWMLIPARQVYLCDPSVPALWKHNHVRKDRRLLDAPDIERVEPEAVNADDLPDLRCAFQQVFIGKHSHLNPDFSTNFLALCREKRFLDLYALRFEGRAVGVLGVMQRHGWVTTPLIGYDTKLPQELGLYRRLMALLLSQARERGARLHYSSGAGQFKRMRGGEPALEYTAIYTRHLPTLAHAAAQLFSSAMNRYAGPLLIRHG
jgi:hypothetical protein